MKDLLLSLRFQRALAPAVGCLIASLGLVAQEEPPEGPAPTADPVTVALSVNWDVVNSDLNAVEGEVNAAASSYVEAQDLVRSPVLTAVESETSFSSAGWQLPASVNPAEDPTTLELGLAPGPDTIIDLASVTFSAKSSPTGPGIMALYTSLDNYQTPVTVSLQPVDTFVTVTRDLSTDTRFQGITTSFNMRLIQLGNTAATGGPTEEAGTYELGTFPVQFVGTALYIPEPSTNVLLLLGGVMLFSRMRKRGK